MNAKPIIHVGIALICLGIAALAYQSVTRTSDEIGDVVKQHANTAAQKSPFVPALVGGLLLVGDRSVRAAPLWGTAFCVEQIIYRGEIMETFKKRQKAWARKWRVILIEYQSKRAL